jgi:hypothetical protein
MTVRGEHGRTIPAEHRHSVVGPAGSAAEFRQLCLCVAFDKQRNEVAHGAPIELGHLSATSATVAVAVAGGCAGLGPGCLLAV